MSDLVKRLRIKAGMIEMGEMIAWGSDSALMREAADALEMAAPDVQGEPMELKEFSKGATYPIGDCGNFVSGIDHNITITNPYQWDHQIEVYGNTPEQAEALRDRILGALESPDVHGGPEIEPYDAGSLCDFGGGDVGWWHDYIRAELDRAYEFYLIQLAAATQPAPQPAEQQPVCPTCPTCYGRGWDMDCQNEFRPATCPDCAGSGKAEHSITVQESDSAAPDVAGLVEALEWIAGADCEPGEGATDFAVAMGRGIAIGNIHRKAAEALAAYRKHEENK